MVLQSWIINCLKMYKISDEVINLIEKTMKTCWVELTAGGKSFAETKIPRGILQGDALSPLLFITAMMSLYHIHSWKQLSKSQEKINHLMYIKLKKMKKNWKLIHTVRIYCQDTGMKFGIGKCAWRTDGTELPNQEKIWTFGEKEINKYLRIFKADTIKQVEMKGKI